MKKRIFVLLTVFVLCSSLAFADWDEYHEIEENSPAYQDNSVNDCNDTNSSMPIGIASDTNRYSYWNKVVRVPTADGGWRYTTRKYATLQGMRYDTVGNFYNQDGRWKYMGNWRGSSEWNPGYSTIGKRFYPNSNYKREVKAKKKYGIITSILNWLI